MLAKRIPSILPDMTFEEMIETTKIHSIAGLLDKNGLVRTRPFRSPHHTVTAVGLGGGGTGTVRPGEVSLAHNGVLFLTNYPNFPECRLKCSVSLLRTEKLRFPVRTEATLILAPLCWLRQ